MTQQSHVSRRSSTETGAVTPPADVDPGARYGAAGELLRALAAPVRIAIVVELQERAQCVHELVGTLGLPQPLISQHLRVLKSAGVVEGRRNGREILYRLVDDHLAHIVTDAIVHSNEQTGTAAERERPHGGQVSTSGEVA
ncbi:ArsR/SmtB family transcription factor [Williamsia sterculiae]|uniref:ArsR family transcriptional regulator n=1 Tax=Williamsia sterculiae TaxID=1344003 RepID=A0A1N7G797_9NOCA|nr:metalloregulator ArsR/SmtB family transcription factor [Williamsia sterculiae]SIS08473.1 ArsR family transcriptional regulator [Williamsia sterculiae]